MKSSEVKRRETVYVRSELAVRAGSRILINISHWHSHLDANYRGCEGSGWKGGGLLIFRRLRLIYPMQTISPGKLLWKYSWNLCARLARAGKGIISEQTSKKSPSLMGFAGMVQTRCCCRSEMCTSRSFFLCIKKKWQLERNTSFMTRARVFMTHSRRPRSLWESLGKPRWKSWITAWRRF